VGPLQLSFSPWLKPLVTPLLRTWTYEKIKCQVRFVYGCLTIFLGLFLYKSTDGESICFCLHFCTIPPTAKLWIILAFLSKFTNHESFCFYWHFCPSLPTVKVLFFIGAFAQVYQLWTILFLLGFLSNSTKGKSFRLSWPLLPKSTNGEIFVFIGIFVQVYDQLKFWSFWSRFLLLATLVTNINGESISVRHKNAGMRSHLKSRKIGQYLGKNWRLGQFIQLQSVLP